MATKTLLLRDYKLVAADVTALTVVQCPISKPGMQNAIELVVAADTPAESVAGLQLRAGETMTGAQVLEDIGTSGKQIGRAHV